MADWVDNYYDPASFDVDGVSMGCRVKLPQPIQKTASDRLHFSWRVSFVGEEGDVKFDELSMHMDGVPQLQLGEVDDDGAIPGRQSVQRDESEGPRSSGGRRDGLHTESPG